ncbi:MAG TPA: hypothetical protein PKD66_15525 [Azonexus sp.]|nr:hypothetical protein [Azonexus sp.]
MIPVIWLINSSYNSNNLLSLGAVSLNRFALRYSLPIFMLALSGSVSAVGLGELRGQPALGERIQLEIDLLGSDTQKLDASCFRLVQPAGGGDFPWLKKATLRVRKGARPVLEIASDTPLREPIVQLAVQVGCGLEVSRDYILLASPQSDTSLPTAERHSQAVESRPLAKVVRKPVRVRSVAPTSIEAPARLAPRRANKPSRDVVLPDRLMLSDGGVGDPSLRLATVLMAAPEAQEEQREILRIEYRMLMAMHQQATSQMATAEKLRNMESTLGELQQHAAGFAQRVEISGSTPAVPSGTSQTSQPLPSSATTAEPHPGVADSVGAKSMPTPPVDAASGGLSEWSLYGVLIGTVLGLAGWLGWRNYRQKKLSGDEVGSPIPVPDVKVDPRRSDEREERGGIDLPFESAAMGMPMQVDVELDSGKEEQFKYSEIPAMLPSQGHDSVLSISATSLDEHFEANPVMELADIMLSFGRVKGAAQALQEYIDNNPQEALQPWIRLMDVYRMAGMRAEFENVAKNLNMHFNVEVQSWDDGLMATGVPSTDNASELPVAPRAACLEDLPRLMNTVIGLWTAGDVVGYLYQLLRDNRGGQRMGFTLPVVEDILFLIELKETANRMENFQ